MMNFQALISVETATIVHRALEEGLLLMVVFSVPLSYIIAMIGHCCYGSHDENDEHEKVDKIYAEVPNWIASRFIRRILSVKVFRGKLRSS